MKRPIEPAPSRGRSRYPEASPEALAWIVEKARGIIDDGLGGACGWEWGDADSPGGWTTLRACARLGREVLEVLDGFTRPSDVAAWIEAEEVRVLNVAGNRESTAPGIGERVEHFLIATFRQLARG